jgi:hypothetical protein
MFDSQASTVVNLFPVSLESVAKAPSPVPSQGLDIQKEILHDQDFSQVSGKLDSRVLRVKIPAIPATRVQVRAPESQKVCMILSGIPGESGI